MQNKYPFFKYVPGDSKVHKMSSKLKIMCLLLSLLIIVLIKDPLCFMLYVILLGIIMIRSQISLKQYGLNLLEVVWFIVIIYIITFFITFDLLISMIISVKFILIVMNLLIITFTTSISEIAWGIEGLFSKLKKLKVPVAKIALSCAATVKFTATLFEQFKTIRKSMAYRGLPYNSNPILIVNKMVIPVTVLSYKRAVKVKKAMKLRFYGCVTNRTNYHGYKETKEGKIFLLAEVILLYLVISLGWII
ncbi:MAG: energy-coupling factor transporter transmembrane protein EcfT [Bacilli bacterium]